MSIIPTSTAPDQHCPRWCLAHIPVADGDGTHHLGVDRSVRFTGGAPGESGWAAVSIERFDEPGRPSTPTEVHLDTVGGPMHPVEALELSSALQRAAFGALGLGDGTDWPATRSWAQDFIADPDTDDRLRDVVSTLLKQAEAELDSRET